MSQFSELRPQASIEQLHDLVAEVVGHPMFYERGAVPQLVRSQFEMLGATLCWALGHAEVNERMLNVIDNLHKTLGHLEGFAAAKRDLANGTVKGRPSALDLLQRFIEEMAQKNLDALPEATSSAPRGVDGLQVSGEHDPVDDVVQRSAHEHDPVDDVVQRSAHEHPELMNKAAWN